ncbi:MAG: ATP-binding cassette domain-containing protein [Methylococcaceae bacterium]|nr:ATP-binding cassette domain-containing protein [Methylococcaceae bacterium]
MATIHIDIHSKIYPSVERAKLHQAIANLYLSLHAEEFVCLVGPSGCGKTTLLNIIAGLDADFKGDITIEHRHDHPMIGYVFQNPRLLPWLTVRENIELVVSDRRSTDVIDALLETMQLKQVQHSYPERLSLGMSRRVAIIRAFVINPDILLMDEPFVSLDAPTARQVRELLRQLWLQRPHTVLFVTHDLREAIALADRIVFLSSAPMRVVSEIKVPLAKTERNDDQAVELFRQQIINNYPEINMLL